MNRTVLEKKTDVEFPYVSFSDLPIYDQRDIPRWKTQKRAYYREEDAPTIFRTQTMDLSSTGVSVQAHLDIPLNQKIKLKIYLSEMLNFETEGTVVWKTIMPDNRCFVGVSFDPLPERTQNMILEYALNDMVMVG